jgi:hypothetical protein
MRSNQLTTFFALLALSTLAVFSSFACAEELLTLDNGTIRIGIDREKGGAITWLSWQNYPKNCVNSIDPGRLIQQSYYAGKSIDRRADGQSESWSPWVWNPIQGGGIGSWARVTAFKRHDDRTLFSETVPKLWDMPDEEGAAIMRQWTAIEPMMPDVIAVRCEFVSQRDQVDRWGPAVRRHQELPACYFTRNFGVAKSYLGDGQWRDESHPPGPPWGKANPPRKSMAFLAANGQGIAIFSPSATTHWNFGPHGLGDSDNPNAGPCMHAAPLDNVALGPRSTYRYRYWLIVGNASTLASRLDELWTKYSTDRSEVSEATESR